MLTQPSRKITPTQLKALDDRRKFYADIATKADALAAEKHEAAVKAWPPGVRQHVTYTSPAASRPPVEAEPKVEQVCLDLGSSAAVASIDVVLEPQPLSTESIQYLVAKVCGISEVEIVSKTRKHARPRQISMYLCHILLNLNYPEIGRHHGGKDHTTVLHGIRKIAGLVGDTSVSQPADFVAPRIDYQLIEQIKEIKSKLLL